MKEKKVIALLVICLIFTASFVLPVFASPDSTEFVYGDFDQDKDVDSDDYSYLRMYLIGMITIDRVPANMDVDGNGRFDSDDYSYMRQYLIGMIRVFPVQISATPSITITPTVTPTVTSTNTPTPVPTTDSELYMTASKESHDTYKVTLNIKDIPNFAGYQANIVYDPKVLKPIYSDGSEYTLQSPVETGSLLNKKYSPSDFAMHDLENGSLNFSRAYVALNSYRNSGVSESTGSIATIYFKMLKNESTQITLENCLTMPNAVNGTLVFDWNGNQLLNYDVKTAISLSPDDTPTNTPIATPTATPTYTSVPSSTPTAASTIYMSSEKISSSSNLIKLTINISNIANLLGYQANLKYDPEVLIPVNADGSDFENSSEVETGTLLNNNKYSPLKVSNHDLTAGILNFGITYMDLDSYKNSGVSESNGSIGIIYFKVLKNTTTEIKFIDCETMTSGINGTILYDWDSNQILNYTVAQSLKIDTSSITPISGNLSLSIDKSNAETGEIVNVFLNLSNMDKISGIQANIKYDPTCLQPVYLDDNSYVPYDKSTVPPKVDLFQKAFSPLEFANNNLTNGIINFGFMYTNLTGYANSQLSDNNGTATKISFKVLKNSPTKIELSPSKNMPGSVNGTYIFDVMGDVTNNYELKTSFVELNKD